MQHNILVLPLESLSDTVEKKKIKCESNETRERERHCVCMCVCTPFALVYVFWQERRGGGSCSRLPVCTTFDNTKVSSMCSSGPEKEWQKKTKKERPWIIWHYGLLVSLFTLFFFFFSFLKIERKKNQYKKGMVLLHTLKCKALLSILWCIWRVCFNPMIFFNKIGEDSGNMCFF